MSATIDKWKEALQRVSGMLGWDLEKLKCGENELIKKVVSTVRQLLKKDDLDVAENLVGMGHLVQEMMEKLGVHYENGQVVEGQRLTGKRVVEISGLPGIGKSTLAKIVYNKIYRLFEECSFLKVEERRLLSLQEDLICDLQKKRYTPRSSAEGAKFIKYKFEDLRVLIVLDGVSDFKQIHSLVIDPSKFGPGSRIIVISMRRNLVSKYIQALETSGTSVDDILAEKYELKQMNDNHAFQLFCKCALGGKPLQEEFSSWAWAISSAAGGLPFVIEAVGLSLYGKPRNFWEEAFDILSREPFNKKIKRILETQYEALEDDAKKIFLDIAFFFMGKDMTISSYMWEACKYHPSTRIAELQDMSLVTTTDNNKLWMHNQVIFLGRQIVKEENPSKPSKRSRLWNQEDIERVLNEDKVATVEAISATFDNPHLFAKRRFFHNFSNLRYLEMNCAILKGHKQTARNFREDLFLPWLKWLEWQSCLNISILLALDLSNLVYLNLSGSTSRNWRCWKQIIKKAKNLKVLILEENTDYSLVIGTDGQRSYFPNLRLRILKDGTTEGAQHRFNRCETPTPFQADGPHISMPMMSQGPSTVAVRQKEKSFRCMRFGWLKRKSALKSL
ncbi:hypothetical protein NL676_039603 [Syzygium grande]|nr:hypothetical protein NL676_039603 [Syzygium grande]